MKKYQMYLIMVVNALLRRKLRMFIALLAVAVGATIISGMVTVYREVPAQMGREFRAYGANLLLLPADGKGTVSEDRLPEVYKSLEGYEVIGHVPFLYERMKINEQPVLTGGTNFEELQKVSPYWQVTGDFPSPESKDILLGSEVAEHLSVKPGQTVFLNTGDSPQDMPFTVSGIVRTGGREEQFAYMNLGVMQKMMNQKNQVSLVQVSMVAGEEALTDIGKRISAADPGIHPRTVQQIVRSEQTVLGKLQGLILLVTVVVLLLTLVCVATTMTAVVTERRKEIGLKKALGADSFHIGGEFLGEACILGALGGLLGTVMGYIFAQSVGLHVFGRGVDFSMSIAVLTVVLSVAVTGAASLIPVRTAVKVEPAVVLRGE